jgi:hypothetical protein
MEAIMTRLQRKVLVFVLGVVLFATAFTYGSGPIDAAIHNLTYAEGGCGGG